MRESKKNVKRKQELELKVARAEFIEEHESISGLAEEIGLPFATEADYVKRRLEEKKLQQPRKPTGKFQDDKRVAARFQRQFVAYIQELCPEVIDELRELVPLFTSLFGENRDTYADIIESRKIELFDLDYIFEGIVNTLLIREPSVSFRIDKHQSFNCDHPWGEYRLVLECFFLLLIKENSSAQERQEVLAAVVGILESELTISSELSANEGNAKAVSRYWAYRIVEGILLSDAGENLVQHGIEKIGRFLDGTVAHPDTKIKSFVTLMTRVLAWANRHRLERTWLLHYAFYFLWRFERSAGVAVKSIDVPVFDVNSLVVYPFEFKFEGWRAGDERKEDYETRLRRHFRAALLNYFHHANSVLELDRRGRATRPLEFERLKWLVRSTVQRWSKTDILDEIYQSSDNAETEESSIDRAFRDFKKYDLPVYTVIADNS